MTLVLDALNSALQHAMADNPNVVLLGEDLLDPYGGAFKVTRNLSSAFPGRVWTTPISEASLVGIGTGLALRGLRPVVEIMFGDFVTLIADQVINHAAKFRWMYNDQVRVPLVIRTPMGGRRGYGPTHSQTLEKIFLGVPGLHVLAPCTFGDPEALLYHSILDQDDPVLFVENKLLYSLAIQDEASLREFNFRQMESSPPYAPTYRLSLGGAPPAALTIAAYGYMADIARLALLRLAYEDEIFAELIVPTQLAPFDLEPLLDSVQKTSRLLAFEEGTQTLGWGAEVLAQAAEYLGPGLTSAKRVAAKDLPIPASGPLETAVLPSIEELLQMARKMV